MKLLALILTVFISIIINLYSEDYTAITGVNIVDVEKGEIIENGVILLKDSIIIAAGKEIKQKLTDNTKIINAKGKYAIPGLVDAHIHFFQSGGLYTRPDGLDLRHRVPYNEEMKFINDNLDDTFRRYLRCGVTTVIDNGGPYWNFDVRSKAASTPHAPRVITSGPLIASWRPDALDVDDDPILQINSISEALAEVQKQYENGTDFIKIWYIVGKGSTAADYFPIVEAIVQKSHSLGLPVYVHATELGTAKKALKAGCDVLVHSVRDGEIDDEFIKLAKKANVCYVPTIWVFSSYAAVYSKQLKLTKEEHFLGNPYVIGTLFDMHELGYDELGERQRKLQIEKKPIETTSTILNNLKKVYDNGIRVVLGTDAGNVAVVHGPSVFHDMQLMSDAGMDNAGILRAATINAAEMIRMQDKLGSLSKNKIADLVLLNSNPLEDIGNCSDINMIFKHGKAFMPEELIAPSPEDLAQIQLNAYNSRDIEAFLLAYSPDVEIYDFPGKLLYKGRENMRTRYTEFFQKATELHCKLVNRISFGSFVMDKEYVVTGIPERGNLEAVAIYEVSNGMIQKVWFVKK